MAVTLYPIPKNGYDKAKNNLGLRREKEQVTFFGKIRPWISRKAPNLRTEIKRKAYIALEKQLSDDPENQEIRGVLEALSNREIETTRLHLKSENATVQQLKADLESEDARVYELFEKTFASAGNKYGYAFKGIGRDSDLATIITTLSHLYKNKTLDGRTVNPALQFLRAPVDNVHDDKRKAVVECMDKLAVLIMNIENLPKSQLNMAFPGDDLKYSALVNPLKTAFNNLALKIDLETRLINIGKERDDLQAERVELQLALDWELRKKAIAKKRHKDYAELPNVQNEEELERLKKDKKRLKKLESTVNPDGDPINYEHKNIELTNIEIQKALAKKQRMKTIKVVLFVVALIVALGVAIGQASIAMGALAGVMAYVIGGASFFTNFFLINRDTNSVLQSSVKTHLYFKGLPKKLGIGLGVQLALSLVAGLLSAGAVFKLMLKVMHFTIATAPAGPMVFAGIIAAVSLVGMGSLFYAGVAAMIRKLKGKTLRDVKKKDKTGKVKKDEDGKDIILQKGLGSQLIEKLKSIGVAPKYNRELLALQAKLAALKKQLNTPKINVSMATDLETQIRMLERQVSVERNMHVARHWLSVVLTGILLPFAAAFAVITSIALMQVSYSGTVNLFTTFTHASKAVAEKIAWVLTWFVALPINGMLYSQSLLGAAVTFGGKLAAVILSVPNLFYALGKNIYYRKLGKTLSDAWTTFKNHPQKAIYKGARALFLLVGTVFVVLNAAGNAEEYVEDATIATPFWRLIAPFCGSAALNGLAIYDVIQGLAPIDTLEADAGKKGLAPIDTLEADAGKSSYASLISGLDGEVVAEKAEIKMPMVVNKQSGKSEPWFKQYGVKFEDGKFKLFFNGKDNAANEEKMGGLQKKQGDLLQFEKV